MPIGPGGNVEVGVSCKQGPTTSLQSSFLMGGCVEFWGGGNWKTLFSTVFAVEGGDMMPGEEMGEGLIKGAWPDMGSNEIKGSKCILCPGLLGPLLDPEAEVTAVESALDGSRKSPAKFIESLFPV